MTLFSTYTLGPIKLENRVVMAPMTRSRAIGYVPNALMAEYYAQRASAGLIITEGIAPSPDGLGYCRIPGLYSDAQIEGFRAITDGVHKKGGKIIAQLMHVGRVAHPDNMPQEARILAPSAIAAAAQMYTDTAGMQAMPTPKAMDDAELSAAQEGFVQAAKNAIAAGFDGVELHSANGYLLEQFLNPTTNQRKDGYGGSVAGRIRFVVEVAQKVAEAIGKDRVGIRISPHNTFNDMGVYDDVQETYVSLIKALPALLYVHVVRNTADAFPKTLSAVREAFDGPLILNGGFDQKSAEAALSDGQADLISFGNRFISNPDLVTRMKTGAPLVDADPNIFFSPGAEGYTDYPALTDAP